MAMKGPLRHELSKYGKGRPGNIRGLPYAGPAGRKHYVAAPLSTSSYSPHQGLYDQPLPHDYHPHPGTASVQFDEYQTGPNWESHRVSHSHQPHLFRPYPVLPPEEEVFDYQKAKVINDFLFKVQELQYRHFDEGEQIPSMADIWMEHFSMVEPETPGMELPEPEMMPDPVNEQTPDDVARNLLNLTDAFSHLKN
ncbi:hypothetical protein ACFL6U_25280, partial [Planctomycetota bacterium]